eukprot:8107514-Alexandrium_andersonii.AAC.1
MRRELRTERGRIVGLCRTRPPSGARRSRPARGWGRRPVQHLHRQCNRSDGDRHRHSHRPCLVELLGPQERV